jgi:uncharacterized protein YbjT (DUF2867 family)
MDETSLLLVTGATGYIGGQLLRVLQAEGRRVRCLVRNPDALSVPPAPATEICAVDVLDGSQLSRAFAGVHTAYYFVHSMSSVGDFASEDRRCARNFGRAAREAGVRRIIYLGGLGDDAGGLSPHLRSRHEVGDVLRESGVPVVEFRASVVIGAGSLSFELIRSLVLRLPVMIVPRWMENPTQPIGTEDVIAYFLAALDLPEGENRLFEIGGPDVVTYGDLVREYARRRGVKRLMIPVPFFSPRLSGLWLRLVAPHYARVGEKLIESLRNPTVVRDPAALRAFPIRPRGIRDTIARALAVEDESFSSARWTDYFRLRPAWRHWGGAVFGSRILDHRSVFVAAPPEEAFRVLQRIGGSNGWYFADALWRFRGLLDRLIGGPGMRGRAHAVELKAGDAVDFWRVEYIEPGRELLLRSELCLPGRAWLQFEIRPVDGGCVIGQTALYDPMGFLGFLAWYASYPFHKMIFSGMIRALSRRAGRREGTA